MSPPPFIISPVTSSLPSASSFLRFPSLTSNSSNHSHFILYQCQSPNTILYSTATLHLSTIHLTHLLPKQFPISIHILIHLPSKLFICLPFALIYTNFSLSFLLCKPPYIFRNITPSPNISFQAASFLSTGASKGNERERERERERGESER